MGGRGEPKWEKTLQSQWWEAGDITVRTESETQLWIVTGSRRRPLSCDVLVPTIQQHYREVDWCCGSHTNSETDTSLPRQPCGLDCDWVSHKDHHLWVWLNSLGAGKMSPQHLTEILIDSAPLKETQPTALLRGLGLGSWHSEVVTNFAHSMTNYQTYSIQSSNSKIQARKLTSSWKKIW